LPSLLKEWLLIVLKGCPSLLSKAGKSFAGAQKNKLSQPGKSIGAFCISLWHVTPQFAGLYHSHLKSTGNVNKCIYLANHLLVKCTVNDK